MMKYIRWYDWVLLAALAMLLLGGCHPGRRPSPRARGVKVLCFVSSKCEPCLRQKPEIAVALKGFRWRYVDIDRESSTAEHYDVGAVPTYVILVNGSEQARATDIRTVRRLLGRR